MAVEIGVFVVPEAEDAGQTLAQIEATDETGLDVRFETLIAWADGADDPVGLIRRIGEDVAPAVRAKLGG